MPLNSWICDTCGDTIVDPSRRGLLVWREDDEGPKRDFHIVHKNMDGRSCDPEYPYRSLGLDAVTGPKGQARLLALLTTGPIIGGRPVLVDLDQFVDAFRRLQTPWYEEARPHFAGEEAQHWLSDANEVYPYVPSTLERIATGRLGSR